MAESSEFHAGGVNKHYLNKVMELAEERDVEAIEDIFDARGMKLIAKGAKISRSLQEKLIVHKLSKPFESSIALEGGVDIRTVVAEARRIAQAVEPIGYVLQATSGDGPSAFDILGKVQFGNAMSMMLTITERGGQEALTHSVMVSLLSICLAKKLGLTLHDQNTLALAGLLHDIGELYIDPVYMDPKKILMPHEWCHIVVHPRVGQMLIGQLEDCSPAVALAVAEHHERFDGAGYPRQLAGKNISACGQILSVAEMISGVLTKKDCPLERAELALKIIPSEHAHQIVSAISSTFRRTRRVVSASQEIPSDEANQRAKVLFNHIATVVEVGNKMNELKAIRSNQAKQLLSQSVKRLQTIRHAFVSTGLDASACEDTVQDQEILFESIVATKEIQWRLRDVARDLALHSSAFESIESEAFHPLISMLDAAPGGKLAASEKSGRTLLLVDDEPNVLSALERMLRPLGYRILTAPDGASALALLAANDVGVILSDHRMPGMTGIELLSRVKTMYPMTVRIILTAHADITTVTDAITLGAVYKFMTKPWDEGELSGVLQKAFDIVDGERSEMATH